MTKNKTKPMTLEEIKMKRGKTDWAKLISEEKKSNRVAGGI
jgi:hypothetical protein